MHNLLEGVTLHHTGGPNLPTNDDMARYHVGIMLDEFGEPYFRKWNNYHKIVNHCYGYNYNTVGVTFVGMQNATPEDWGKYPLTKRALEEMCLVCAEICELFRQRNHDIETAENKTHAERGLEYRAWDCPNGYGPLSGDKYTKWDILTEPMPATPANARESGRIIRGKISWYRAQIRHSKREIRPEHFLSRYRSR